MRLDARWIGLSCAVWAATSEPVPAQPVPAQLVPAQLVPAQLVTARAPLVLDQGASIRPLGPHLERLVDPERQWTFDDVTSPPLSERFEPVSAAQRSAASAGQGLWLRFRLELADERTWLLMVSYSALERICVHWPLAAGYESTCTGFATKFSTRPVDHQGFVFPVPRDLADRPIYLEAASTFPVEVPVEAITAGAFYDKVRDHQLMLGLLFGILLAMVAYNTFLFVGSRDAAYLYYALHIAGIGLALFGFRGLAAEYLWPERPELRALPLLFLNVSFLFGALFVRRLLLTRDQTPRLDLGLRGVSLLASLGAIAVFFNWTLAYVVASATVIGFSLVVSIAAIVRWRAGYRPARFLLGALALFLLMSVLTGLRTLGITFGLPPMPHVVLSSVALGTLLLSFGLADRLRQLHAERARLLPELEARNAEMERFVYTLSHDLRTPLLTIQGFGGLLRKDASAGDTERLSRDIGEISRAADELRRLLDELLQAARLGYRLETREDVSLEQVARGAVEDLAAKADLRHAEIEILPGLPVVRGDRALLLDVMRILLDNAVTHSPAGAGLHIEVGARRHSSAQICFVRDNGAGIEPIYHEKIFQLFEKLDAAGEGVGAGLSRAKRIVELHGGRLWVESEGAGRGSTFCFELPR